MESPSIDDTLAGVYHAVLDFLRSHQSFVGVRRLHCRPEMESIGFHNSLSVSFTIHMYSDHLSIHSGSIISKYEYSNPTFPQNLYQRLLELSNQEIK